MQKRFVGAAATALLVAGCTNAATAVIDQPSSITLKSALESTVEAIYSARIKSAALRAEIGGAPLGLNVCDVTAVFNITATGVDTRNGSITVGTPANLYVSASVMAGRTDTTTATRGNQITVRFTSPACNPADTLGTKSPGDVVLLEREIEAAREGAPDPIHHASGPSQRPRPDLALRIAPTSSRVTKAVPSTDNSVSLNERARGDGSDITGPAPPGASKFLRDYQK